MLPQHEGGGPALGDGMSFKRCLRWLKGWASLKSSPPSSEQLRPTAYLDGLRGFAAFLVYWHHHELFSHASQTNDANATFENAFGYKGEFHLATFYGVRNFFTGGHIAVAIFYVISGYVLSVKPMSLIHSGDYIKLGDNLASALFRRWLRLFIPLIVTTFAYMSLISIFGIWTSNIKLQDTYAQEAWKWYTEFKNFSFIFKDGLPWLPYNTHLWSIPLEMRGSIVIYTSLLAFSRATTKARLLGELALIFYFLYIVDGYYCALFIVGMMQCDLDMLAKRPDAYFPQFLRRLEPMKTFIYYHLFFIAIYLAGVPSEVADVQKLRSNPGWYWLSFLKPQAVFDPKWFYLCLAASLLVACIPRISWLKAFFESRFCQYMGRIAFSLYLVHGPVLNVIGDRVYTAVGWVRPIQEHKLMLARWINIFPLPKTGPMGLEISFIVPNIILFPLTVWLADVVTRTVDEPALRFSSWLYKKTLVFGAHPPEQSGIEMRLA